MILHCILNLAPDILCQTEYICCSCMACLSVDTLDCMFYIRSLRSIFDTLVWHLCLDGEFVTPFLDMGFTDTGVKEVPGLEIHSSSPWDLAVRMHLKIIYPHPRL